MSEPKKSALKYYRLLFHLPSLRLLIVLNALFYTAIFLLLNPTYRLNSLISLSVVYLVECIVLHRTGNALSKISRLLSLVLFSNIYILFYILVNKLFSREASLIELLVLASLSPIPVIIGFMGLNKRSISISMALLIMPISIAIALGEVTEVFNKALIPYIIGAAIIALVTLQRVNGISAVELGSSYLRTWVMHDRSIEKVFRRKSCRSRVKARLINGGSLLMIYPDIHFGPFRDIGSSDFPQVIWGKASERGLKALVLHGMGSHERNIVSKDESLKYAEEILESIKDGEEILIGRPFTISLGDWSATVIPFSKVAIAFISGMRGIDDLPYELQLYVNEIAGKKGCQEIILVDSHNEELSRGLEFHDIKGLVESIVERLVSIKEFFREAYVSVVDSKVESTPGVLGNVVFASINVGEESLGILYVPGNNMARGVREYLEEIIKANGYSHVVVLTNDDHVATGIIPGDAYTPVILTPELINVVKELTSKAIGNHSKVSFKLSKVEDELELFCSFVNEVEEFAQRAIPLTILLLLVYYIAIPLVIAI
ncbi:MAG: DUF2070 family protein [Sulfolobales archaeon]|nr:DUF2070 family protein [Sulfolobales archaeon]MCX8198576.1 DUF2070 family protein [Sulfolobales archaeon]MDW8169650.1 DUF2070 family protein [Desulfurococcaceae archaeon]